MPTPLDSLLDEFPEATRDQVRRAWEALPGPVRERLEPHLDSLPSGLARWRVLLDLSLAHLKAAAGRKGRVAIVGPANVGKSTLYNQLLRAGQPAAEVSPIPGTTRVNQEADAGPFSVIDTPGADAVGEVGEREKGLALAAARGADFLVVVFDAAQGIKRDEQALFDELQALGRKQVVALNKIDLVKGHDREVLAKAAQSLHLEPDQVVPCAAKDGKNVDRLLLAIAKADPEIVAALGQALPAYRRKLAMQQTQRAASTAAAIALAPIPILDVIPLLALQASLVLGIARIYRYAITPGRAKELIATFGLGFLGRTFFQELSKLGGPPGWVLAAAIAASTTMVMGYGAALWFERGERLTADTLRALSRRLAERLVRSLRGLGRRKPARRRLEEEVAGLLEEEGFPDVTSTPGTASRPGG